jgi:hypothetical protein
VLCWLGKSQQKIIVEKVNIEAGGQAAIGVYEGGWGKKYAQEART